METLKRSIEIVDQPLEQALRAGRHCGGDFIDVEPVPMVSSAVAGL